MIIDDVFKLSLDGEIVESMLQSLCFDIDNVGAYFYEQNLRDQSEDEEGHYPYDLPKEIPNMAPLADHMWFEYAGATIGHPSDRYGVSIRVVWDAAKGDPIPEVWKTSETFSFPPETRWVLGACWFGQTVNRWETSTHGIHLDYWQDYFFLREDGSLLQSGHARNPSHPPGDPRWDTPMLTHQVAIALLAICFCHCKGITVEEIKPSRQVRRAAERQNKRLFTFRTLNIKPVEKVLCEEGDIKHNGIKKALHICRGHFSHYTSEKPLFGKYVGTYYIPMHVRGSAEKGIGAKKYKVYAK